MEIPQEGERHDRIPGPERRRFLKRAATSLIAAHGNSLRALVKHLDGVSDDGIVGLNTRTGVPLLCELDPELRPLRHEYRGDPGQVRKAQEAVARQGKVAGVENP